MDVPEEMDATTVKPHLESIECLPAYRTQSFKGVDGWSLKTMQGSVSNEYVHLFYEEFYKLCFF